jgi:hypothetical protein
VVWLLVTMDYSPIIQACSVKNLAGDLILDSGSHFLMIADFARDPTSRIRDAYEYRVDKIDILS